RQISNCSSMLSGWPSANFESRLSSQSARARTSRNRCRRSSTGGLVAEGTLSSASSAEVVSGDTRSCPPAKEPTAEITARDTPTPNQTYHGRVEQRFMQLSHPLLIQPVPSAPRHGVLLPPPRGRRRRAPPHHDLLVGETTTPAARTNRRREPCPRRWPPARAL